MNMTEIRQWVADAIADGWDAQPTYNSEPIEQAVSMKKEGFKVSAIMRPAETAPSWSRRRDEYNISAWGPDDLAIRVPVQYNFEELKRRLNICESCGKEGETVRLAFANRVCPECREKKKDTYERRGWCD